MLKSTYKGQLFHETTNLKSVAINQGLAYNSTHMPLYDIIFVLFSINISL